MQLISDNRPFRSAWKTSVSWSVLALSFYNPVFLEQIIDAENKSILKGYQSFY